MRVRGASRKWRQKEQERWVKHHSGVGSDGEEGVDADGVTTEQGGTEPGTGQESGGEDQEKQSINAVPDVEVRAPMA